MSTLEGQISNPILSPMLNEKGPALFEDENGDLFRIIGVIAPNSAGDSGLTAGVAASGAVSQVTGRADDAAIVATGKPKIPVVALVGVNPATGDAIPFVAGSAASAAKLTGKFQSAVVVATGSAQDVAHGLGVVPSLVLIVPQDNTASGSTPFSFQIAEGTHTTTNVVLTATSGLKFKVIAFV